MRVLCASTRGAGHLYPLVPIAEACLRRGHEVMVAGPPQLASMVETAGYPFWEFADPPEDELDAVWSRVPTLPSWEEQNATVVGEIFGRLDTTAALPRLREACEEWRPDVIVRDPNEYGSALAGELQGIPHARVAIGLGAMEEIGLRMVADRLGEIRETVGLDPQTGVETLRRSPIFSAFPSSLEDPSEPEQPDTRRFRDPAWDEPGAELPDWWPTGDAPLVYVTFGSVAGGQDMAAALFGGAIQALADLPVRVLLTVGREVDPTTLEAPPNVRVEQWVPQADVLGHATAVVCHGGSGSTLGALAAGLPLVVVPLFADQPRNAERVAAVGAGISVQPPAPPAIGEAVLRVLEDEPYRTAAEAVAAELRSHPPADAAAEALERLAARGGMSR
jgi:UDP:flavonoid glycosyltransferase YjiC (YdhE family)